MEQGGGKRMDSGGILGAQENTLSPHKHSSWDSQRHVLPERDPEELVLHTNSQSGPYMISPFCLCTIRLCFIHNSKCWQVCKHLSQKQSAAAGIDILTQKGWLRACSSRRPRLKQQSGYLTQPWCSSKKSLKAFKSLHTVTTIIATWKAIKNFPRRKVVRKL